MTDFENWLEEAWRLAKAEILIRNTLEQEGRTGKSFVKALRMLKVAMGALEYNKDINYNADALAQINEIAKEKE